MKPYLQLTRPFTMLAPFIGMLAGGLAAYHERLVQDTLGVADPWELALRVLIAAIAAAWLNSASNALNQICDIEIDRVAKPTRPIPSGRLSMRQAKTFTLFSYFASLAMAFWAGGAMTLGIFALAAFMTWMYSAPPLRTRRFPWLANITIAIPRGLLLPVAGWSVIAGIDNFRPWFVGLIPALYLLGAAATKDFADIEGDKANGVVTIPIKYGVKRAAQIIAPFLVVPFLVMGLFPAFFGETVTTAERGFMAVAGGVLALWGAWTARTLLKDPHALATTENHPAWKHMYFIMLAHWGFVIIAHLP